MFVTHLECSLTGERYDAGQVHNLSRAGKPLLVRYDLDGIAGTLTKAKLASLPVARVPEAPASITSAVASTAHHEVKAHAIAILSGLFESGDFAHC